MIDALGQLGESIVGIVKSAISGDWSGLSTNIVGTIRDSIEVGSAAFGSAKEGLSSAAAEK